MKLVSFLTAIFLFWDGAAVALSPSSFTHCFPAQKGTVLIVGYGQIGKNVAAALQRDGYGVWVYDTDPDKREEAAKKKFITLFDLPAFLESWRRPEKAPFPLVVADCAPSGAGAKNFDAVYKNFPGIRGVVFQGGEKAEVADLNYSPELTGFPEGKKPRTIRVQPCSLTAMIQIFVPILRHFEGREVKIFNRSIRDTQWKEEFEPYSPYHHRDSLLKQLELNAPDLKRGLAISTAAKTDLDSLYHWNYAEVAAPGITREKVVALLRPNRRLAVVEPADGVFDPADMMVLHPADGSGATTVQVVPAGPDRVGIYFAVPHTTNVVPPTLDAVHLLLGDLPQKEAQFQVDGNERMFRAKVLTEMAMAGQDFGLNFWLEKYKAAGDRREKLRIVKIISVGGLPEETVAWLEKIREIETDPSVKQFISNCFRNYTFPELYRHLAKEWFPARSASLESSV